MQKDSSVYVFSSPLKRATAYTILFATGSAIFETFRHSIPHEFLLPAIALIISFVLLGIFLIHNQNLLSRITSGSVLFILSIIAIGFGGVIPASYELLLAIGLIGLSMQPFLHRRQNSLFKTILCSLCIVATAFVFAFALLFVSALVFHAATAHPL